MNDITQGGTHQKYDKSLEDRIDMYDKQIYKKDADLINEAQIKLISGNILKYYTFQYNASQPYLIETHDDVLKERFSRM